MKPPAGWGIVHAYAGMNFLHFATALFAVCTLVLVGVSLATRPPDAARLEGLTFQSTQRLAAASPRSRASLWLSLVLAAAVLAVWLYFRR